MVSDEYEYIASGILGCKPTLPAKSFELSLQFYGSLGFLAKPLTPSLVQMTLGACSFLLQDYYVQAWAENCVIHLFVADVYQWWERIQRLDLPARYNVKCAAPRLEAWGTEVAGMCDPSGVLWRFHQDQPDGPSSAAVPGPYQRR